MTKRRDKSDAEALKSSLEPADQKDHKGAESAFDVWLKRGLHKMYDAAASEPIPEEMLKLIEEDRKRKA